MTNSPTITLVEHLEDVRVIRDAAARDGDWSSAQKGEHLRGEASGLYTLSSQLINPGGAATLSSDFDLASASDSEVNTYFHKIGLLGGDMIRTYKLLIL